MRAFVHSVAMAVLVAGDIAKDFAAAVLVWAWKHSPQGRAYREWADAARRATHELRRRQFNERVMYLRGRDL